VTALPLDVLAHELRSPVAALVAIAEAFPAADDPRRRRLLELAGAAVGAIERLLVDAAPASLRRERLDASTLIHDAVEAAALAGGLVVVDAPKGLLVHGDAARLRQALDNLIGNAVGHSPVGEAVTVTGRVDGEGVVVEVSDAGEGIAPDQLERVFEPGVRLTAARPGQGIGLAVARTIARAHGGEVELESSPGRGATFRLVLPAASAAR
jgi:two-component system OmpR family sensor kinase